MASDAQMKRHSTEDVNKKSKLGVISETKKKSKFSTLSQGQKSKQSLGTLSGRSMSRMKVRKQSYGFAGISGIRNVERTSQFGIEFKRPALMFLPTYQLDPRVPFDPAPVIKVAEEFLDEYFTDYKYNNTEAPQLAMDIAGCLMRSIKDMNFNRYRIITVVTLGQRRAQSYNSALGFLWDQERDNCATVDRVVQTAFIHVTIFGVYLD